MQLYVELTPAGGVLRPEPGRYSGPVVLTRPITIEGRGKVIIDSEGVGSVLTIEADNTVIKGLHLTNSGESFDKTDAGITLKADKVIIENNRIDHSRIGFELIFSHENEMIGNFIEHNNTGIVLIYSNDVVIKKITSVI